MLDFDASHRLPILYNLILTPIRAFEESQGIDVEIVVSLHMDPIKSLIIVEF